MIEDFRVAIVVCIGLITAIVSAMVLKQSSALSHPRIIGTCVGILAALGLLNMKEDILNFILLPYAALAIACILVGIIWLLSKMGLFNRGPRAPFNDHIGRKGDKL